MCAQKANTSSENRESPSPAPPPAQTFAKGHPDFVFVTSAPPAIRESASGSLVTIPSAALRECMVLIADQPYFAALNEADLEYLAVRMKEAHLMKCQCLMRVRRQPT